MTTPTTPRRTALGALTLGLGLGFATLLSACSSGDSGAAGTETTGPVKIGVVGASDPYWAVYQETAAAAGIEIELIDCTDSALPNPALSEGELDINQFQHIVYLADYIAKSGNDLVPLGSTAIYPLSLFSLKYDSVEAIPDGEQVVVPDDPSNQARALLLLQSVGLIELKGGGTIFSSLADIDLAASRITVTTVAADLTPTTLQDAAAAIINNDYVRGAGLDFDQAIAKDDPADASALPYVNIFAVRPEDKANPTYLKLVELYQDTKAVTDGVQEQSGGVAEIVKISQADLQASLDKTVADTKAQG
jgi:D-methionine transport system substrate-binding protein